jgi:hypothetical protein
MDGLSEKKLLLNLSHASKELELMVFFLTLQKRLPKYSTDDL